MDIANTVITHGPSLEWAVKYSPGDSVRVRNKEGHLLHFSYLEEDNLGWVVTTDNYPGTETEPSRRPFPQEYIRR
jgi:hypothetical protein